MLTIKKARVAVILFYLLLFTVLALYDERPNQEMLRVITRPLPDPIESGNAWVVCLGFAAPEGTSPFAYGEKKMLQLKNLLLSAKDSKEIRRKWTETLLTSTGESKSGLSFKGELPSFWGMKGNGMLAYATTHQGEIAVLIKNNTELLSRYESLRKCPRYNEPVDFGYYTPFPSWWTIGSPHYLNLLKLAVKANQGDVRGALTDLREDMDFWRLVSRSSSTLISKLISYRHLYSDLLFASDLGTYHPLKSEEMDLLRDILRPFNDGEISMTKTLQDEFRYMEKGMELSIHLESSSFDRMLFKKNAFNNRMFEYWRYYVRLAELPSQKFALKVSNHEEKYSGRIGIPFLYNPAGEILVLITEGAGIPGYIEREHNAEGLRRLALLKVLIYQENNSPERIQQFLDAHANDLGDPYTGGPMKWDPKKRSISFKQPAGDKSTEIFL